MNIPKTPYRCPLGKYQISQPDPEDIKRTGWRTQGILVVSPTDARLSWVEQEQLKQIAEKLYGRREVKRV